MEYNNHSGYVPTVMYATDAADLASAHTGTSLTGVGTILNKPAVSNTPMRSDIRCTYDLCGNPIYSLKAADLYDLQQPPIVKLDELAFNARQIVENMHTITSTIKRQTDEKDALIAKFTSFTEISTKFKDLQNQLIALISSEIPENTDLLDMFITSRTTTEKTLASIELAFNASLEKKISTLRDHLNHNYQNRAELMKFMSEGVQTIRELEGAAKKANPCGICYDKEVDTCIVPCGHTFCSGCTTNMGSSCACCRTNIEKSVKMYLSL